MNTDYKVGNLIYDANIYDGLNTFLSDLPFYKKWLPTDKNAQILELCCGTGRLTIPIAKDGYNICGVDYTSSMLEQAKLKATKERLEIDFVEADIRTLDISNKYDLIFIPFNSIHHLYTNQDLFDTLNVVKKHLKENGLFLLDCYNPSIHYIVEAEKERKIIAEYTTSDGRKVLIKQTMRYENATQINRIGWHYFINDRFHSIQNLDMRMYFPQELDTYLKQFGFEIIHKFGNFEEEKFNDKSEKQIFVCKTIISSKTKIQKAGNEDYAQIMLVWESSVKATHHFLKSEDFQFYQDILPGFFPELDLYVLCSEEEIVAFMGISGENLEMLFVSSEARGKGYGKTLLEYAINKCYITKVDVNEQNQQAVGFYEKFGFNVVGRSEKDSMGKDYPILHLRLNKS